jgi:Transcription initiation factor IIA, gamma subunit, helical domain
MSTLELYRNSALGDALQECIGEMGGSLSPELAARILEHFDRAYDELLSKKITSKVKLTVRIVFGPNTAVSYRRPQFRRLLITVGVVQGTVESYNFVLDIMKLRLKNVQLVIKESESKAKNVPTLTLNVDDLTVVGVKKERTEVSLAYHDIHSPV